VGRFVGLATGEAMGDATGEETGGESSSSGLFRKSPSFSQWASQHFNHVSSAAISHSSQFSFGLQ